MNREQVLQLIQEHFRTNYLSGAPAIPPHTHNGIDNLPIPYANLTGVPTTTGGLNGYQVFTTSGTFTVPTGFTEFMVEVLGGGQGGSAVSGYTTGGANGGKGGDYAKSILNLSKVTSVSVTIGAGGASTVNGGDSSFGSSVVAAGGGSATTSVGTLIIPQDAGGAGYGISSLAVGAYGGSSPYGYGGAINPVTSGKSTGSIGTGYGVGGGGAARLSEDGISAPGGAGTAGIVIISW